MNAARGWVAAAICVLAWAAAARGGETQEQVECRIVPESLHCAIPDAARKERLRLLLALEVTNRAERPLLLTRFDTIQPVLKKASGQTYRLEGGRDATRPPTLADYRMLRPGESTTFLIDAALYWDQGKLCLGGGDGFGGVWLFRGLDKGELALAIRFVAGRARDVTIRGDRGALTILKESVWEGDVTTAPARLTLDDSRPQ